VLLPALDKVIARLRELAHATGRPADAVAHPRPAGTPTTLGKEMANVAARLMRARGASPASLLGKINGAVGNYNAHAAYPDVRLGSFAQALRRIAGPGVQSLHHPDRTARRMAELFDAFARANTILIDARPRHLGLHLARLLQAEAEGRRIGSSTMPHKVNPIDFENSEGNLGLANAVLRTLAEKLPISRWQRDLTDSTVLRNMGVAFGYTLLAYDSCCAA
jgi:adenylosuccinate lyase